MGGRGDPVSGAGARSAYVGDDRLARARVMNHLREFVDAVRLASGAVNVEQDRIDVGVIERRVEIPRKTLDGRAAAEVREEVRVTEDRPFDGDDRHPVALARLFRSAQAPGLPRRD